jgi:hypothetical protein
MEYKNVSAKYTYTRLFDDLVMLGKQKPNPTCQNTFNRIIKESEDFVCRCYEDTQEYIDFWIKTVRLSAKCGYLMGKCKLSKNGLPVNFNNFFPSMISGNGNTNGKSNVIVCSNKNQNLVQMLEGIREILYKNRDKLVYFEE